MYEPSHAVTVANRIVTLLLVLAMFVPAAIVIDAASGSLRLPMQVSPDRLRGLPPHAEFADWPDVRVDIPDPTTKQVALHALEQIAPFLLVVPGLWLLRAFLQSVLAGDPFGEANARRLRTIALLLLVGAPLVGLVQWMLRNALFNTVESNLAGEGWSVPGTPILAGLAVLILAEVFAYGVRLREDVEATV